MLTCSIVQSINVNPQVLQRINPCPLLQSYFTRARAIPEEEQVVEEAGGPGLGARLFGRGKEAADEAAGACKHARVWLNSVSTQLSHCS